MRLRLHQDRPHIEQLLSDYAWLAKRAIHTVAEANAFAQFVNHLQPYTYIAALSLHQSDEKKLQQQLQQTFAHCNEQLPQAIRVLHDELNYSRNPNTAAVRETYLQLRNTVQDKALEELIGAQSTTVTLQTLENYRQELQHLFHTEHTIGDQGLQQDCIRILCVLDEISKAAQANKTLHTIATGIASYTHREADRLQLKLAEHVSYALTEFPQALMRSGKSTYAAEELVRGYTADCIAVEHQLKAITQRAQHILAQQPPHTALTSLLISVPHTRVDALAQQLSTLGHVERFAYIPYILLHTDEEQAAEILTRPRTLFADRKAVVYAPRHYHVHVLQEPLHMDNWNLALVGAEQAWEKTRGENATVAVIDTGIDYRHKALEQRFGSTKGIDFITHGDPHDDNGHGTHVAGTIAGETTGVAPRCTLYAVKVLDASGSGSEVGVLKGIEWAIQQQVDVINMSLGSPYASNAEADIIRVAAQKGIAVACAAGNDGDNSYNYPASHEGAISVAAVERTKKKAHFSNYNDKVDLAAPGVSVYSTWPGNSYNVLSGTSMATPHVAGACALLKALKRNDPETILKKTAEALGASDCYGSGLIRAGEATR